MRIGALSSVILNCNLDTRKDGSLKPNHYLAGWGEDRKYLMIFQPQDIEKEVESRNRTEDKSLNNPEVWKEAKESFKMMFGK